MTVSTIKTAEEFQEVLNNHNEFFLLKHSLVCPISAGAKKHFDAVGAEAEIPFYVLPVQEARPLSNYIEETFNVKHQSPQALLFKNGKVIWQASHWKITDSSLRKAILI